MGKKSRRPHRNKPKDIPAAAATALVARPRQVITSATDDVAALLVVTFNQLLDSQDWEGLLELESEMSVIAKLLENTQPSPAGGINFNLGTAHKCLGREGGIEKATLYYQKAIEMAKKAGDNAILTDGVLNLSECYLMTGRVDEAMDRHKSLCEEIGKESLDPIAILQFGEILQDQHENSRALTILEEYLEAIESFWENKNQCLAYQMIAFLYFKKNDFAKSAVYFERQLSIAKETKNVELEAYALHGIGSNYGRMGDFGNAVAYLEQSLLLESKRGGDRILVAYGRLGDVLALQQGREKEAILMFQNCAGLLEEGMEGNDSDALIRVFLKLGQAYRSIGAWDDSIASLKKATKSSEDESLDHELKALAMESLGNTYLAKYESPPERNDELIRKALFWSEAAFDLQNSEGIENLPLYLDLTQEHYFLGDTEKAHIALKRYLDKIVRLGPSHCQTCHQICEKDAHMEKCSVCKVARYCSLAHSIQAWKQGRLCHKVMCPLLKRWRKITEGTGTTAELCDELFNKCFERVLGSKPK